MLVLSGELVSSRLLILASQVFKLTEKTIRSLGIWKSVAVTLGKGNNI